MIQPEFILTTHAKERLIDRLGTKPHKLLRVCKKAWKSKPLNLPIANKLRYSTSFDPKRKNIQYRELFGYVFIFDVSPTGYQKRLITLYK